MVEVQRASLADRAADALLERIRSGEWPLGARLPGETTLGPQLGVGRSTVREAIRQLSGRGVLESRQGAGVFVTALEVVDDWDAVLRRAGIAAVIEARIAIESEAAALAAERRPPQALRAIRRELAERLRHRESTEGHVDADMRFHRAVIAASGNPVLLELFDAFVPRLRRAMIDMLRLGRHLDEAADGSAHAELVEAIAARDAEEARRLSRTHLDALKDALRIPRSGH
ncbi:FadR family transcriptional regulator [Leucobacter sp. CSA1]|uniref:FadR family transcriptional regulator n=1 Tax=Leucobacter chromiisoli TaxID=2796471 RepID=A0A934UV67_9MICO|nr:FCD domain-containing protein [Leucobacter chromiisoli]MBK0419585.1 FadR family transcriptional regulator [Leucobacter chromiisoli]